MGNVRAPGAVVAAAAAVLLAASVFGLFRGDTDHDGSDAVDGARVVAIADFAYEPPVLTVPVGATATWQNEDSAVHTVTSDGAGPLDSGDIAGGGMYEATFDEPGTHAYVCTIHPSMKGTVEVTS